MGKAFLFGIGGGANEQQLTTNPYTESVSMGGGELLHFSITATYQYPNGVTPADIVDGSNTYRAGTAPLDMFKAILADATSVSGTALQAMIANRITNILIHRELTGYESGGVTTPLTGNSINNAVYSISYMDIPAFGICACVITCVDFELGDGVPLVPRTMQILGNNDNDTWTLQASYLGEDGAKMESCTSPLPTLSNSGWVNNKQSIRIVSDIFSGLDSNTFASHVSVWAIPAANSRTDFMNYQIVPSGTMTMPDGGKIDVEFEMLNPPANPNAIDLEVTYARF